MAVYSGIYANFGLERKDLITEATAREFRDWMAIMGFDISFMSDETLNGNFGGNRQPSRQWEIRLAFIRDIESLGAEVYRENEAWEAFQVKYLGEAHRRQG